MTDNEKKAKRKRAFATRTFRSGVEWLHAARRCHCSKEPCAGMIRNALHCRKKAAKFRRLARELEA